MSSTSEPLHGQSLQASLTVKDLHKSLAWYVEMLGFTIAHHDEGRSARHAAHRHALGRANLPGARPRWLQVDDLESRGSIRRTSSGAAT